MLLAVEDAQALDPDELNILKQLGQGVALAVDAGHAGLQRALDGRVVAGRVDYAALKAAPQALDGYLAEVADRYGYILFAVNWTGMDEDDTDTITLMIPATVMIQPMSCLMRSSKGRLTVAGSPMRVS